MGMNRNYFRGNVDAALIWAVAGQGRRSGGIVTAEEHNGECLQVWTREPWQNTSFTIPTYVLMARRYPSRESNTTVPQARNTLTVTNGDLIVWKVKRKDGKHPMSVMLV
jgi:hypothetical protein